MRVLTWNLFHGRAVPDAPRDAAGRVRRAARRLGRGTSRCCRRCRRGGRRRSARACGAQRAHRADLAQLAAAAARALAAERRPDLIKSRGGGANAILVRGEAIADAPRAHAARAGPSGAWCTACALERGWWVVQPARPGATPRRARRPTSRWPRRRRCAWAARRARRARRRPQHARSGGAGLRRASPATASTTSSRDCCARRRSGAYARARPALGPRAGAGARCLGRIGARRRRDRT